MEESEPLVAESPFAVALKTLAANFVEFAYPIVHSRRERDFISHFGICPLTLAYFWHSFALPVLPPRANFTATHMLWTMWFLKSTPVNWPQAGSRFSVDPRTLQRHVFFGLNLIDEVLPEVRLRLFFSVVLLFISVIINNNNK